MLGFGLGEILMVAAVILVIVGPDRLPGFMRTAGRMYGQLRRASDELRRAFVLEADRVEEEERERERAEQRRRHEEARRQALERTGQDAVAQERQLAGLPAEPPDPAAPGDEAPAAEAASPAAAEAASPAAAEAASPLAGAGSPPAGISPEEWEALPPHVRDLLREGQGGR